MTATIPPQTAPGDQPGFDAQRTSVAGSSQAASSGQREVDTQGPHAAAGPKPPADQALPDTQTVGVGGALSPSEDHIEVDAQSGNVLGGTPTPDRAISGPTPKGNAPGQDLTSAADHALSDTQLVRVGGGEREPGTAICGSTPIEYAPFLVSRELAVLAERVHALEEFRKACANQHQALTDTKPHKDGEHRGQHLPEEHPVAIQSAEIVNSVKAVEDQLVKSLEKELKRSPLGPWIKAQKGLGPKTIARLLASTGDPYWNDLHDRPRTVSELWSFCGMRPGQRKAKGQQVNWSPEAKMRAHVIVEPIVKMISKPCYSEKDDQGAYVRGVHIDGECTCSPYRVLYDEARAKYSGSIHPEDCVRCGPKGSPALAGSLRSAKHQSAMALRIVKKRILRDLWREAARLHGLRL